MPRTETITCDCGCGSIRQESNHWWMVYISGSHGPQWGICEWDESSKNSPGIMFAAGQACAHALLDQFLSKSRTIGASIKQTVEGLPDDQPG